MCRATPWLLAGSSESLVCFRSWGTPTVGVSVHIDRILLDLNPTQCYLLGSIIQMTQWVAVAVRQVAPGHHSSREASTWGGWLMESERMKKRIRSFVNVFLMILVQIQRCSGLMFSDKDRQDKVHWISGSPFVPLNSLREGGREDHIHLDAIHVNCC